MSNRAPVTVLITTRNEEANIGRTLVTVRDWVTKIYVIDSESTDRTVEIARSAGAEVVSLPYDHSRIIPWIFQWGLDNLAIETEWVLILEADQSVTVDLWKEITELLGREVIAENGFYIRRRQIFRGKPIRFGGYGSKRLLKLFRYGKGRLDPVEQDTRVYVDGAVGRLEGVLEEWNRKEDSILFYLEKHLRYAEAFAQEEHRRRTERLEFKGQPRLFGTPDERVLWMKRLWYRMPLYVRPFLYFGYRYILRLGILDGWNGFVFHFLQAFWFRLVLDIRLGELLSRSQERRSRL